MCENETLSKIIKFAITGGLGTITNLFIFLVLADFLGMNENAASCVAFLIAGTQNYCVNQKWTFKKTPHEKLRISLWIKYLASNIVGLLVNIAVMNILLNIAEWPLKAVPQGIGILCGMGVNFLLANFFVFRR